jgi:hypothetical protein
MVDPNKEETMRQVAKMTTVMRAYTLAKKRRIEATPWVSRKEGEKFGQKNARPRRIRTFEGKYRRKMFGEEEEGHLYSVRHTSMHEISQHFGLSIGLYFHTLYQCGKFFVLIFIVSTPAVFSYYADQEGTDLPPELFGTAVCTDFQNVTVQHGYGWTIYERNDCNPTNAHVAAAFMVLPMIVFFLRSFSNHVESAIAEIDDCVVSAQDFAVEVMDPDDDAFDPGAPFRIYSLRRFTNWFRLLCTLKMSGTGFL